MGELVNHRLRNKSLSNRIQPSFLIQYQKNQKNLKSFFLKFTVSGRTKKVQQLFSTKKAF